jgi:1-deoxyxylulose-5-phosphate synthase
MSRKPFDKSPRRLTPRDALRLFHAPRLLRPTRRQVLGSFLFGTAFSCAGSESPSEGAAQDTSGTPATPGVAPQGALPQEPQGATPGPLQPVVTPSQPSDPVEPVSPSEMNPPMEPAAAMPDPGNPEPATPAVVPEPAPVAVQPDTPDDLPAMAPSEPEPVDVAPAETMEATQPNPAPTTMGRSAYDLVELGNTGIVISRLAMGSGTNGVDNSSVQTRMGDAFSQLLVDGYDRGIRFFETADAYGSHFLVAEAMRQVGRQNVTLLTKTMAETREEAEADLARFMEELDTDYLDIVLLHIRTSGNWTTEGEGAMEVLAEAKARGQIRAHGVSCHSLEALQLAAQTDWVDVDLARINPYSLHMDSDPATVISVLDGMKASGKGVLGMKILGQGDAVDRFDEAIAHATRLDCIHGFTIGFRSLDELDQVATKIASV